MAFLVFDLGGTLMKDVYKRQLLSWRHFPGCHPPCSRSFIFQGSMSPDKNQFTEKRGLLPYVQDAGKDVYKRQS